MGSKRGKRTGRRPVQQVAGSRRLLRLDAVLQVTGLSRSAVYKAINEGRIPKAVPLSAKAVGFLESEIDQWIAGRVAARDAAAA